VDAGKTVRLWVRQVTAAVATPAQRQVAEAVMAAVTARFEPPVHARADLVDDDSGQPEVLEVGLVEPSPFLDTAAGAPQRLAGALRQPHQGRLKSPFATCPRRHVVRRGIGLSMTIRYGSSGGGTVGPGGTDRVSGWNGPRVRERSSAALTSAPTRMAIPVRNNQKMRMATPAKAP
jgi:hypothetical protein